MQRLLTRASSEYFEMDTHPVAGGQYVAGIFWIGPTAVNVLQVPLYIGQSDSAATYYRLEISTAGIPSFVSRKAGGSETHATWGGALSAGTWHMLAWAVAYDEKTIGISVDAGDWVVATTPNDGIWAVCNRTSVGRSGDATPGQYFGGALGPMGIWRDIAPQMPPVLTAARNGLSLSRIDPANRLGLWTFRGAGLDWELDYSSGRRSIQPSTSIPNTAHGPPVSTARRDISFSWTRPTYSPPPPPPPPPPAPGMVELKWQSTVLGKKNSQGTPPGRPSTLTFSGISVGGGDVLQIDVGVLAEFAGTEIESVSYGGAALTKRRGEWYTGDQTAVNVTSWRLLDPPIGQPADVVVTASKALWSGAIKCYGYSGADRDNLLAASSGNADATSSSSTPSVSVSVEAGDFVSFFAGLQGHDGHPGSVTWTGSTSGGAGKSDGSSLTTDISAVAASKVATASGLETAKATFNVADGRGWGMFVARAAGESEGPGPSPPPPPPGDLHPYYQNSFGATCHSCTQGDLESTGSPRRGKCVRFTAAYTGPVRGVVWQSQGARWWGRSDEGYVNGVKGSPTTGTAHGWHSHGDPEYRIDVYECDAQGNRTSTQVATSNHFWPCTQEGSGGFDASNPTKNPNGSRALTKMKGGLEVVAWMNFTGDSSKFSGAAQVLMPLYVPGSPNTKWVAEQGKIYEIVWRNLSPQWWLNWCGGNEAVAPFAPRPIAGRFSPMTLADPMLGIFGLSESDGRTSTSLHTPHFLLAYVDGRAFGQPNFYLGGSSSSGWVRARQGSIITASQPQDEISGNQGVRQVYTPPYAGFDSGVQTHMVAHVFRYPRSGYTGNAALQGRLMRRPVAGGAWEQVWPASGWQNFSSDHATLPVTAPDGTKAEPTSLPNWGSKRNAFSSAMAEGTKWVRWALPAGFRFTGQYTYAMELRAQSGCCFIIGRVRNIREFYKTGTPGESSDKYLLSVQPALEIPQFASYGSSGRSYNRAEWSPNVTVAAPTWNRCWADHELYPITYVAIP